MTHKATEAIAQVRAALPVTAYIHEIDTFDDEGYSCLRRVLSFNPRPVWHDRHEVTAVNETEPLCKVSDALQAYGAMEARVLELERIERNRDMWKQQCERQAAQLTRMQWEMQRYLPILERIADTNLWGEFTSGTGIATLNGYRAALANQPQPAPEIFPGTRAALDNLTTKEKS